MTVSFEHSSYTVPEGNFPDGSISYVQVNVLLSAAPNTFPDGTFDFDSSGRLQVPITRESLGGTTHGVDYYGVPAYVRFEPAETTTFLDGGESTVTATLDRATSETVTLTVWATAVSPAVPGDFALSANNVLTITAGQTSSTGTVTITTEDNDVDAAKTLTVSAAVTSGPTGLTAPASQTLTITDDETAPVVTLVLTPASISENGDASTVTATLSGSSSEDMTVTVSAAPVAPAVPGDFKLSTNRVLTITAGQASSTGTATITAENNAVDAPDRRVTVAGTVTGGNGAAAPVARTLTITGNAASVASGFPTPRRASVRIPPTPSVVLASTEKKLTVRTHGGSSSLFRVGPLFGRFTRVGRSSGFCRRGVRQVGARAFRQPAPGSRCRRCILARFHAQPRPL